MLIIFLNLAGALGVLMFIVSLRYPGDGYDPRL